MMQPDALDMLSKRILRSGLIAALVLAAMTAFALYLSFDTRKKMTPRDVTQALVDSLRIEHHELLANQDSIKAAVKQ